MLVTHQDGVAVIATESIHVKCENCTSTKNQQLIVFQKNAIIWGIPFIATGREGILECPDCKFFIEEKQFDFKTKSQFDELSKQTKTPFKSYLGLTIALSFVAVIVLFKFLGSINTAEYAHNPEKGDVYEVEVDGSYTVYKIAKIKGDSIYFLVSKYQTDELSGLDKVKSKNQYYEELFVVSKKEVKSFYEEGSISSIERGE